MTRPTSRADQLREAIAGHTRPAPPADGTATVEYRIKQLEDQIDTLAKEQRAIVWAVIGTIVAGAIAQIAGV